MISDPTSSELSRIKAESSAWSVARERGLTAEEQDRFFDWMAADPRHSEWLAKHQQGLKSLKMLAHWRPEHSTRPNPNLLAAFAKPKPGAKLLRWFVPVGLAAAVALTAVWWSRPDREANPIELLTVRKVLEDGSKIDLSHGAEVEVTYTPERRDVRLLRGEATFKVAKDPGRPFNVVASGVTVRAVGTAFNVDLGEKSVAVLVTEGSVKVNGPDQLPASRPPELPVLDAGLQMVVPLTHAGSPTIERASQAALNRVRRWRPTQLEFNDTPLAQVVAELNGENRLKLVIADPVIASMPMGASLRTDNVEGFVRILESNFGLKTEQRGDSIVIRRGH